LTAGIARGLAGGARKTKTHTSRPNRWSRVKILGGWYDLVKKVSAKGLFTHDFDGSFTSYIAMLKSGLPEVRNNAGAHGEGLEAAAVTAPIARFALYLTAAYILFVGDSYALMKKRGRQGSGT